MVRPNLKFLLAAMGVIFVLGLAVACTDEQDLSDAEIAEIKKILIERSISEYFAYKGNCPCPYNFDVVGRRCGERSAHTKPGGASPLCYDSDVSDEMVKRYRDKSR